MAPLIALFITALHTVLSFLPSIISSRIRAFLFSASIGLDLTLLSSPVIINRTTVTSAKLPASVFSQRPLSPHRPNSRTIVIIPGVSSTAHEDPRIVSLAHALCAAHPNNIVVAPYVPQLAEIRLQDEVVLGIRDIGSDISDDDSLCPSGHISIVSPCISGGFSIVAATYLSNVESMLLIGPHASVENALEHALSTKGSDDSRYGINSVLASFYHPPNEPVTKMLAAYCYDDHKRNVDMPSNELQPLLDQYPEEAQEFHRLHDDDGEFLSAKLKELFNEHRAAFDSMSPMLRLQHLNTKSITLVHSKTDEIVPPNESIVLRDALSDRIDTSVSCLITSLLNHGDQTPLSAKDIPEILKLINTFSNFFRPPRSSSNEKRKKVS